jgi:hypothetical protein
MNCSASNNKPKNHNSSRFFPKSTKTCIQQLLEAQQHKKYAQITPLDDGVSSLSCS